jgi:hypothetical protein
LKADAYRNVDTFLDEIFRPVAQTDVEVDPRMFAYEWFEPGQDALNAQPDRQTDAERAARLVPLLNETRFRFVKLLEGMPRALEVPLAAIRQCHPPRGSVEQSDAQVLLEPRDRPTDRGHRQREVARRAREASHLGHVDEDLDIVDRGLHCPLLLRNEHK